MSWSGGIGELHGAELEHAVYPHEDPVIDAEKAGEVVDAAFPGVDGIDNGRLMLGGPGWRDGLETAPATGWGSRSGEPVPQYGRSSKVGLGGRFDVRINKWSTNIDGGHFVIY